MTVSEENAVFKQRIEKEYHSNIIPHKGDIIEECMWEEGAQFEINNVFINYADDICCVELRDKITDSIEETKELITEAKNWGWK